MSDLRVLFEQQGTKRAERPNDDNQMLGPRETLFLGGGCIYAATHLLQGMRAR